jgi:hypothetical protein
MPIQIQIRSYPKFSSLLLLLLFIYLFTSKLQKKPSALKREHPALQNMKFGSGYGSPDLIESGSETLEMS